MNEWHAPTHYATAVGIVDEHNAWLEDQWSSALRKGKDTLLVIDEIQKVPDWKELVKFLWDKTKSRGIKVVLLGSTSLTDLLGSRSKESMAGRFIPLYVPHWSYAETAEAFGVDAATYSLFGGYPKAMEFVENPAKWQEYLGGSIVNPIIDVDIYQQGGFQDVSRLRRAFRVFCEAADDEINYTKCLRKIQPKGNTEIVKRYLNGYFDSFLMHPIYSIDDEGHQDTSRNPKLMLSCPAIYTFGRNQFQKPDEDRVRFRQAVACELHQIPHKSFGHWKSDSGEGMDLYIRTVDGHVFGVAIGEGKASSTKSKGRDAFRKTFKNARVVSINCENFADFIKGQRAFLESTAI